MASEVVVSEFVAEAGEHLSNTERDLLGMEESPSGDDPEAINRVFRAIHSIKGASGTFGFPAVMELSHAMESVLLLFRDGGMQPDRHTVNVLLAGVDKLRFMIGDIHASNEVDCHDEVCRLQAILNGERREPDCRAATLQVKDPVRPDDIVFEAEREQIASAVSMCHYVCSICVRDEQDLEEKQSSYQELVAKLQTYGQCLDERKLEPGDTAARNGTPAERCSCFLFTTILEPDLIGAALGIPDEQVHLIGTEALQKLLQKEPASATPKPARGQQCVEPALLQHTEKAVNQAPETIRVNVALLDTLINLAGELVLGRNQLRQMLEASVDENPRLRNIIQNVNLVTSEMQEHILRMRMQPLNNILNRIHRLVRDLSRQLEKEVEFHAEGGDVELDKSILEGLVDPLIHIIRNCMDHGIETPRERLAKGKSAVGEIRLRAFHEAGQVNITIADDGRGVDMEKVVEKATARGILSVEDARRMSEKEKVALVFLPGFSTANAVTDISGRGVGMDVVKNNIERFGGHIDIDSLVGSGTTIRITIPLTLAIIPSLIVGAAGQRFAIPQVNIRELVCIRAEDAARRVEKVGEAPVLRLRERLLPLVRLADVAGLVRTFVHPATGEEREDRRIHIADRRQARDDSAASDSDRRRLPNGRRHTQQSDTFVVVLRAGGNLFGLIVDELFDIEEIVVKPLSDHIKDCQCFAGATIMGDGRVAMILDAAGIASLAKLRFAEVSAEQRRRQAEEQRREKGTMAERQSIIVFNNASREHFAVPLSSISRLEKIRPQTVERIGIQELITYCGKPLPLIRLENFLPVRPLPESLEELYVIIPKTGGLTVGIVASSIVDTFESAAVVERAADMHRGFLGSSVIEGRITMFVDTEELVRMFKEEIHWNGSRQRGEQALWVQDSSLPS